jgi:hypothetical protein
MWPRPRIVAAHFPAAEVEEIRVGEAAGLQLVEHSQPELGALGGLDPDAQDFFAAPQVDADASTP